MVRAKTPVSSSVLGESGMREVRDGGFRQRSVYYHLHCMIGFILKIIGVGGKDISRQCGFAIYKKCKGLWHLVGPIEPKCAAPAWPFGAPCGLAPL